MLPKKKIQTGILLAGVLLVWGIVAIKFCKDFWNTGGMTAPLPAQRNINRDTVENRYVLHTYDRDPFLSVFTDTASMATEDTPVAVRTMVLPRPVVVLPEYCGTVGNKEERIAIVRLQEQFHFVKRMERIGYLQVTAIADDTLTLSAAGVRYRIGLKQNKEDKIQVSR